MNKKLSKYSPVILIIAGLFITYLTDINRCKKKRAEREKRYNVELEIAREDIQYLFGKSCQRGKDIAGLLTAPNLPNQPKLLQNKMKQIKPMNLFVINGTKVTCLTNQGKSKKLTKKVLFLVEKAKKEGMGNVAMEKISEKENGLYHILPIGQTGKVLLVEINTDLILNRPHIKRLSSRYSIEVSGPYEKGVLVNGELSESQHTVKAHLGLAQVPFVLKLTPKEKEEFPWDRIFTWGWGFMITSGLVSFLSILQKKNVNLEESKQVIEEDKRKLHELAIKDPLTNIFNRRHFEKLLHSEFRRAKRYSFPLSCIMLDIDHFKNFNDTYGHQFGDEVLKEVAGLLKNLTREVDIVARYGGEEFIVILPETDSEGALTLAERIRGRLAGKQYTCKGKKLTITVSLGVSTMKPDSEDIADEQKLVFQADQALYQAKGAGRNRVYHFAVKEVKYMGKLYEDINHVVKDLEHIHADIEHLESHLREHPECKVAPEIGSHVQDMDNHLHDVLSHMHHIEAEHDLKKEE